MDFQTMRIYGSIAIILGCFIFLYPKLLHPIVLNLFCMNTKQQEAKTNDFVPPQLRDKRPEMGGGHSDLPEHVRKMRGPHPGMRAAAAEQAKQTKGSGRGMMGVILPMYAVGIVVYLIYTLFKVFGKSDKSENSRSPSRDMPRSSYDIGQQGDEQGTVSKGEKTPDSLTEQDLKGQLSQLQSLASSVKGSDMKEMDMRKLQERLAETEAQMTKILAAMQAVQSKVSDVAPTATGTDSKNAEKQDGETEEKKEPLNVSDRSSESSPESESYEIVNKSDRESSGEENSPRKVETLTSTTAEDIQEDDEEEGEAMEQDDVEQPEEDEVKEEILKDKEEEEETKTVRKRITKKEDTES